MYFFWIAFILQQFSFRSVCLHAQYHNDAMPMIPTFDCIDMLAELSWARTLVSDDLPLPPSGPYPVHFLRAAAAHHAVVARTRCVMRGVVIISDKLFNDLVLYPLDAPLTYLHPQALQALQDWEGKTGR